MPGVKRNHHPLLNVEEARKRLHGLSQEEIQEVRDYEKRHKRRQPLLREIKRHLQDFA